MDHDRRAFETSPDSRFLPGDYRLVGLAGFSGDRWIIDFDGELDMPTRSVTLGHSQPQGLIAVCTAGRAEYDKIRGPKGGSANFDWSKEFAFMQLLQLLIWDCPSRLDGDERRAYSRGEGEYAQTHAEAWLGWEPATWKLDGVALSARVFRFGRRWVGVTDEDPQRRISVFAHDSFPVDTTLVLTEVDSADYGWVFTKPFKLSQFQPPAPPDYAVAQLSGPLLPGPEHREVMSTQPRPVTYTRDGVTYRLEVREHPGPEAS